MLTISSDSLRQFRVQVYRSSPAQTLKTYEDAVSFINQRGFVFFWPIRRTEMPSLWAAVAGNRPVADEHDDPGHITWGWKDDMIRNKACYYGKILRGKATLIGWETLPYFYALSENLGDPSEDHLQRYRQGRLPFEAKSIYEAILDSGPLDTIALRRKVRMTSEASESRFTKALTDLQKAFLLAPVGITNSGGWRYAFEYDIPARYLPDLLEQTRFINEYKARQVILVRYIESVGTARAQQIARLFGWSLEISEKAIEAAASCGLLKTDVHLESEKGSWAAVLGLPVESICNPEIETK